MGILWASNSHPPQRDLAHRCSRLDPGLNKTALLWFWLLAFQAWDAPVYPPPLHPTSSAGNLEAESPARSEDAGKPG